MTDDTHILSSETEHVATADLANSPSLTYRPRKSARLFEHLGRPLVCCQHFKCYAFVLQRSPTIVVSLSCLLQMVVGVLLLTRHPPRFHDAAVATEPLVTSGASMLIAGPAMTACILFSRSWQRHRRKAEHARGEVGRENSHESPSLFYEGCVSSENFAVTDGEAGIKATDDDNNVRLAQKVRVLLNQHMQTQMRPTLLQLTLAQSAHLDHHCSRIASQIENIIGNFKTDSEHPWMEDLETFLFRSPSPARCRTKFGGNTNLGEEIAKHALEEDAKVQPSQKMVKLSDHEILTLYNSAQHEAQVEADWRGIDWPSTGLEGSTNLQDHLHKNCQTPLGQEACGGSTEKKVHEYLRILRVAALEGNPEPPENCFQVFEKVFEDHPVATQVDVKGTICCGASPGTSSRLPLGKQYRSLQRPPSPVAPPLLP